MKPTVPETGLMVAKRIRSDKIVTGEVKSGEERWYPKYIQH
jgi:hypothetical protein